MGTPNTSLDNGNWRISSFSIVVVVQPMGKAEEEQHLPRGVTSSDPSQNTETQCRCSSSQIRKLLGFRCILVFIFSLALFLSALFWLPPFVDHNNLNDNTKYKGDFFLLDLSVAALFCGYRSVSVLGFTIIN